ncbi:MAG: hypothetical protein LBS60_08965 [Deltaproteobacteria bacterium]|jgi:hypothetical protein|nr:hypothetical protein [Deltaproteobacteria bacterium]
MTEAVATSLVLFDDKSLEQSSELFYITSGWFGVLSAYGFLDISVPIDPDLPWTKQRACLNQVELGNVIIPEDRPCGVINKAGSNSYVEIIAEGPLALHGCPWHLSACHNKAILDIPGTYRLILNDPVAAGSVQIYLKVYPLNSLSKNSALSIGGF